MVVKLDRPIESWDQIIDNGIIHEVCMACTHRLESQVNECSNMVINMMLEVTK